MAEQTAALELRIGQIEERQRLLEAKSSLGLIVGEILHEGAPAANFLASSAARLRKGWPLVRETGPKSDEIRADFPERLELMSDAGDRLRALFLMLQPLAGGARTPPRSFNVVNALRNAKAIFDQHEIDIQVLGLSQPIYLFGHAEDLSAALINLLSNAVHWLEQAQREQPKIVMETWSSGPDAVISVTDNGPGIPEEGAVSLMRTRLHCAHASRGTHNLSS